MPYLWSDLISQSFLDMGATAAGESPNPSEQTDAYYRLAGLLLSLNIEGATLWTEQVDTQALTEGLANYTMGPGGVGGFNTARPLRLKGVRCMVGSTYGRGVKVITDPAEWSAIVERDSPLTLPIKLYVDYSWPLATLHFWPPSSGAPANLTVDTIETFSTLAPDTPAGMVTQFAQQVMRRRQYFAGALNENTGNFTMGPGGTLNTSRPAQVVAAHVGLGAYGHDIDIIGAAEWAALIEAEGAGIVLPLMVYPTFAFPNATLSFWPVPGAGVTAEIHSPYQIPSLVMPPSAGLANAVVLPPGFQRMLHFALAVDLYPSYRRGSGIPAELAGDFADAKAAVIAGNVSAGQASPPPTPK